MAICGDCFREFLHPLVHESMNKNQRFRKQYGIFDRWDWDADSAILTFSNGGVPKLRIEAAIVGTTEGASWEWSWGNPNVPAYSRQSLDKVREFAESRGFEQLTSKFAKADEYTGWEMTAVAAHVLDAQGSYRFPTEKGFCYLVYRKIHDLC